MLDPDYSEVLQRIQGVYASCSLQEQLALTKILEEVALKGYSQTYEQVFLADFKEVPVSIDQFISDPYYLGASNDCGKSVYLFWRNMLSDLFANTNRYNEVVLSGATRIGKSSTAVTIMAYMLYRLMIYRDPHSYFKKKPVSKFTIAFANLNEKLAYGVAYREYQDTLKATPWFMDRGKLSRSDRNFYYIPEGDNIEIIAGSDSSMFLGKQIFAAMMDECSFAKAGVKDINLAKQHMKKLYDTINARVSGTFRLDGEVYGKLITSSSKNQDDDFLSDHIENQLNSGNQHLYLVDEPQWKILPKEMFSDKVFHFTVGDRYKKGFVIPEENDDEEHRKEYEAQGYKVMEAPAELRKNFLADYDISLRDIAGISVAGAMGFITQEALTVCIAQDRVNPFYEDVLQIGKNDSLQIYDFFHLDAVPNELKYQKMNIHLDMAETGDRTGISGTCVCGNKIIEDDNGHKIAMPYMKNVFSVGIQAPRGDRQSFQKVINFIIWLRNNKFNVGTISADQYQSSYALEMLEQQNFEVAKISVDRSMEPYISLMNLIIDQRIELVKCQLLEDELINLQRLSNKFDHRPDKSKDISDSLCGSCWTLVTEQVTAHPPVKSIAATIAAVNGGRGSSPISSSRYSAPSNLSNKGIGAMFAGVRR